MRRNAGGKVGWPFGNGRCRSGVQTQEAFRIIAEAPLPALQGSLIATAKLLMHRQKCQADAALDEFSAHMKGVGNSPMAGKANILIMPDLNCGNIAYKLVQRLGGCRAVGPVLWGTAQPANDLSRGCSSEDVLDMLALTSIQHQRTPLRESPSNV